MPFSLLSLYGHLWSQKEVNILVVSKLLNYPHKPTSSSTWGLLSLVYSLKKLKFKKNWNSGLKQSCSLWSKQGIKPWCLAQKMFQLIPTEQDHFFLTGKVKSISYFSNKKNKYEIFCDFLTIFLNFFITNLKCCLYCKREILKQCFIIFLSVKRCHILNQR